VAFRRAVYWDKEAESLIKGSWLYREPEVGQGADTADGTLGYFPYRKRSFSLAGFDEKGYFFPNNAGRLY